jgi:hypothetical protein
MGKFEEQCSTVNWGSKSKKERVLKYLEETSGANIGEFLRRIAMERVTEHEERQALLRKQISA